MQADQADLQQQEARMNESVQTAIMSMSKTYDCTDTYTVQSPTIKK
eukprot:CAMPEP_0178716898 /NCGR_PEP_ID=MMETSP0699-20121125/21585_1 /TAXON_ID=265572 /ORGANISM="Extubocellulus spinifer, Strain CCMP396" /LENGTH=45 /DNA_ID= /DNA_START= /DNA_END= /DNA_ORIENTATION=